MTDQPVILQKFDRSTAPADDFIAELRRRFFYDPATGDLVRKTGRKLKGTPCAGVAGNGYRYVRILGRNYGVHQIVWALHYGRLPSGWLDHINRDHLDNRIENLRESDPLNNSCNQGLPKNNKSGFKGVRQRHGRWYVQIVYKGYAHHLGSFDCRYEAAKAYDAKARELHGKAAATNEELGLFAKAAA